MPDDILGGQGTTLLMAGLIVGVALLALVAVFKLLRARSSSTFIRGGRNRQPRLAVLDAAAVDTRRRLVLIRRDDVEHLVMIGGPTDIVIESRISRDPARAAAPPSPPPDHRPVQTAQAAKPAATAQTGTAHAAASAPPPAPAETRQGPAPAEPAAPPHRPAAPPQPAAPRTPDVDGPAPPAAAVGLVTGAARVGSIQAEAASALEDARARVFEEPSFDGDDFDELTAAGPVASSAPASRLEPEPTAGVRTGPVSTSADFEAVLAAELSGDLSLDLPGESRFEPRIDRQPSVDAGPSPAPEVQIETRPSRESLEAEMERLLGDLSRKP